MQRLLYQHVAVVQLYHVQIRSMKLLEFQETHSGDLTGPALEEIRSRHQALKLQLSAPLTTGTAFANGHRLRAM